MDGLKGQVRKSLNDVTPEQWDAMRDKYAKAAEQEKKDMEKDDLSTYPSVNDPVERPVHYNTGSVECIEAIKASMSYMEYQGYLKGNTMKYLWRYNYKGKPVEDLNKARWYLDKLIEEIK